MPSFNERLRHAWNAFFSRDPTQPLPLKVTEGMSYGHRPDRTRMSRGNERSIVTSVITRIAIDTAAVKIQHVRVDQNGRFSDVVQSGLNNCLTIEANIDQTGRALIQDIVMSMLDEGVVAVVPIDTSVNPATSTSYEINTMRVGKITEWYPQAVKVRLYNDRTGRYEEIILLKRQVAIIENPLYAVMNEPNSTLQRLIRKLNLLDVIDEQSGAGKLDLIIQLPYVVKTESRRQQAEKRRRDIEDQLAGSKYGIAYTDGTEKIQQLNRSVDNQLMSQIEYLTTMLYGQLGITDDVITGKADDKTMINYYNRTTEPILSAIADEFKRKFLTKTARTQGQSIMFFRDPFKLVPVEQVAEIADKFTRNEIASTNEMRSVIGWKPVDDPRADELRNKNLNKEKNLGEDEEPVLTTETENTHVPE